MYYTRRRIVRIRDFWFEDARQKKQEKGADYVQYHDMVMTMNDKSNLVMEYTTQTIVNDITDDMEEIIMKFKRISRSQIKEAQKEGCSSVFYFGKELEGKKDVLKKIDRERINMFDSKGLKDVSKYNEMLSAAREGMLAVSIAKLPDGRECVYHVYIVGNGRSRILHSISMFREYDSREGRNAVGRANRNLHYEDMINLKKLKVDVYDWGGYSESEEFCSISRFKASFGGEVKEIHRYIFAVSFVGRLCARFISKRLEKREQ
jgi:hypothetical protein